MYRFMVSADQYSMCRRAPDAGRAIRVYDYIIVIFVSYMN